MHWHSEKIQWLICFYCTLISDRLMLGIGIGCACGATGAFLIVFIVTLFKSKCRSPKIVSPRVKTVEPMNGGPHTMRTPSVNGSMDSTDSITHSRNGFIRRPISTSRRSSMVDGKSNGFLPWETLVVIFGWAGVLKSVAATVKEKAEVTWCESVSPI